MRRTQRAADELRPISITMDYLDNTEGSVFFQLGNTMCIATATLTTDTPAFARNEGIGWIFAEYGMLPRSVDERIPRTRITGRAMEIQRFIGRALRAAVDLSLLKGYSVTIDCDVIRADGSTRCACVNAGFLALYRAMQYAVAQGLVPQNPIKCFIAAVSVGLVDGEYLLDLDYAEDYNAAVDFNLVLNEKYELVEVQGTAEKSAFTFDDMTQFYELAKIGVGQLITEMRRALFPQAT